MASSVDGCRSPSATTTTCAVPLLPGPRALRSLPVAVVDAAPVAIEEDISRDVAAPEALLLTGGAVSNLLEAFWRIHGNSVKFLVRTPTAP